MDFSHEMARDGVLACLAGFLLKILWDAVYKKIPRGFRSVRDLLQTLDQQAIARHQDHIAHMENLEDIVHDALTTKAGEATKSPTARPQRRTRAPAPRAPKK